MAPSSTNGVTPTTTLASTSSSATPETSTTTATVIPHDTTTTLTPRYRAEISAVTAAMLAHSYKADCPVRPEDLVEVTITHWGFDDRVHEGRIVVARSEGDHVADIFRRLFEIGYPIESVIPIGDLPVGIEDDDPNYNNTSALHCRRATGSTRWSDHARGLAIDINPLQNPYVSSTTLWPANAGRYVDRSLGEPGVIVAGDAVVLAFADNGWKWGGYWSSIKDYQHFSVTGR